jgi:hypothetical protein
MVAICENLDEAFQSACDLWVIPEKGAWLARLDWHLNWQVCKALEHAPATPAPELLDLVREQDFDFDFKGARGPKPLLVSAEGLLPTSLCLIRTEEDTPAAETTAIREYASSLKANRILLFTSAKVNPAKVADAWEKLSSEIELRVAPEDLL